MSLPPPQVWRLLPIPPVAPSTSFVPTATTAVQSLASKTDLGTSMNPNNSTRNNKGSGSSNKPSSASQKQQPQQIQRNATLHPVLPWVAYTIEDDVVSSGAAGQQQYQQLNVVVQNVTTQQILWHMNWMDLAACLYGERNPSKLPAATKSLGSTIISLAFLDPSSVYWSGMSVASSTPNTSAADGNNNNNNMPHFTWLAVQTNSRVLVLQLRQSQYSSAVVLTPYSATATAAGGASVTTTPFNHHRFTRQAWLVSHLHEKALGSTPSSNLLPIDANTWLVGCADGSLKAWDRTTHQPVKSIKGLGKGDWIVQILPANRYSNQSSNTSGGSGSGGTSAGGQPPALTATRRILTITKKNSVYLIELEFLIGVTPAGGAGYTNMTAAMLEIRPPLARFVSTAAAAGTDTVSGKDRMDHGSVVSYDAHRDWIMWLVPARKGTTTITSVLVWNLHDLQTEFLKHDDSSSSSGIFKPDPTLTIQFPAGPSDENSLSSSMTVLPTIQHAAFSESTVICGVATELGDIYLQVAAVTASNKNASAIATPVMGVNLAQLLERDLSLERSNEDDPPPMIRVYAVRAQPLGERPMLLCVTNVGLVSSPLSFPFVTVPRLLRLFFAEDRRTD